MALRFRALGPLQVWQDGEIATLGATKQRLLLTALLLEPNRPVSDGRLITALWEDSPPRSALANLRTYANRLRHVLAGPSVDSGEERIVNRHSGYLLCVRPGELDITDFREYLRKGRAALTDGDPRSAARHLAAGLALWRGSAAEDVPRTLGVAPQLDALDEQRYLALESHVQARLALGEHYELIGELQETLAAHPTRERLWSHLMVALYRSGDHAGSLAAYAEAGRTIHRHLGVELGPGLRDLHRAILDRAPVLAGPPRQSDGYRCQPQRRQSLAGETLPAEPRTFVGRVKALRSLVHRLTSGQGGKTVAVHGAAGMGKSALALKAAHAVSGRYPDGQIYVDLLGSTHGSTPLTPVTALGRLLRGLGVPAAEIPADQDEAMLLFRSVTAHRTMLVVLDNAVDESQVRPLVSTGPGCATLVTSRPMLCALDGAVHLDLGPPSDHEAREMLAARCGLERVQADLTHTTRIVALCGRLPLALRIAGTRLATRREWSPAAYAEVLEDERQRLDALQCGDLSIRLSLAAGYQALLDGPTRTDLRAAVLFRRLGLLPARDFDAAIAAALLDECVTLTSAALGRLADVRLIEPAPLGRYRVFDLIRLFAREQAMRGDTPEQREQALERVLNCFVDAYCPAPAPCAPAAARPLA
ncbi:winged helix-turn-helix domain-containing protein [Microtetraspora sp. AC03309]|uniref:AfsR/SARP family transcriptional regulator n=1 Tax=Microtetraspora sp. AC03309 TaxID=2779376 RepID=UPI001E318950|nr:BTAD domain-containing putative transcriptional regulator [Microtetraspora sp. AC03309]MCC5579595.1 winged helix-turn-helix domain-containing protein [Microtetraspora sp. AC03309]